METAVGKSIDRVWSVRDAVLKWLYLKTMVEHNRVPTLVADDIAKTVGWQGDPITEEDVAMASDWLLEERYISGTASWGHGVPRPSITPRGEALADAGLSVRPGNRPADPQGITTIHITNSTNVAIGSPGASQTYTYSEQLGKAIAVADALDSSQSSAETTEAHRIADQIRAEVGQAQPNSNRLKELIMSAVTAGTGALGQTAATELIHLASQALQSF